MILLKLKLVWLFSVFVLTIGLEAFSAVRSVVFYGLLTIAVAWIFLTTLTTVSLEPPSILYPAVDPQSPPETTLHLDESAARKLLARYRDILVTQPNHRDVLLNAAQLHLALGELELGQELREQARLLDPNHPSFQEN